MKKIRLVIVDDSLFIRKAIQRIFEKNIQIECVGTASCGEEFFEKFSDWKPDVVLLDLSMPGMGGLATLEKIMEQNPLPVIILSTHLSQDPNYTIEALHKGAIDFIDKQQYSLVDFDTLSSVLTDKVVSAAKSFTNTLSICKKTKNGYEECSENSNTLQPLPTSKDYDIVLIGASTGGPPAIQLILEGLNNNLPVPIIVVQHMPLGFTKVFAERLNAHLKIPVKEAVNNEPILPGKVYIAPSGFHIHIKRKKGREFIFLSSFPSGYSHIPSVDVLFGSAAQVYGSRAIGILLTGMGNDGAKGMKMLRKENAYTIAQDEETSIVYGMPKEAVKEGGVCEILPLEKISKRINELLGLKNLHGQQKND